MIVNFSVRNFGSIKDRQTLSFEAARSNELEDHYIIKAGGLRLLKMAFIYGANASGKTTVLKALYFLRCLVKMPATQKTDELGFTPFLFDPVTPHQDSMLAIDFVENEVRYSYEVVFNKKAIVSEELNFYSPNKANIYKRTTDLERQLTSVTFGKKIKINKSDERILEGNTIWNNTVLAGFLKTNIDLRELKEATAWFDALSPSFENTDDLYKLVAPVFSNPLDRSSVINILKKADLNISDAFVKEGLEAKYIGTLIEFSKKGEIPFEQVETIREQDKINNVKIEFEHTVNGVKYLLPIEHESQGTKRYYGIAGLLTLLIDRPAVMSIDELESSLHPDLFIHFILTFLVNAKSSQVVATTHNREILNNKDLFRNDAIWFTDKGADGATKLYSLADFDTKTIRDTTNVYNAYKAGRLGGVPRLGDYYINQHNEEATAK